METRFGMSLNYLKELYSISFVLPISVLSKALRLDSMQQYEMTSQMRNTGTPILQTSILNQLHSA